MQSLSRLLRREKRFFRFRGDRKKYFPSQFINFINLFNLKAYANQNSLF